MLGCPNLPAGYEHLPRDSSGRAKAGGGERYVLCSPTMPGMRQVSFFRCHPWCRVLGCRPARIAAMPIHCGAVRSPFYCCAVKGVWHLYASGKKEKSIWSVRRSSGCFTAVHGYSILSEPACPVACGNHAVRFVLNVTSLGDRHSPVACFRCCHPASNSNPHVIAILQRPFSILVSPPVERCPPVRSPTRLHASSCRIIFAGGALVGGCNLQQTGGCCTPRRWERGPSFERSPRGRTTRDGSSWTTRESRATLECSSRWKPATPPTPSPRRSAPTWE